MAVLENIEPKSVMRFFEEICSIPHGSYHTDKIADYLVDFASKRGLECTRDASNNVIIKKGASNCDSTTPVILQGHTDMVCEKEDDSTIDFLNDGLKLIVDGDVVMADKTTLGADDGIAVAMILALLDSDSYVHPPIEAVFTTDEEVGMLGAAALDCNDLKSKYLINLDSEDEGHILASCAGGVRAHVKKDFKTTSQTGVLAELRVSGLLGGHSGQEIDKGRANADVLLARVLYEMAETKYSIASMSGGTKDNAIPRNAAALLMFVNKDAFLKASKILSTILNKIKTEYMHTDKNICIDLAIKSEGSTEKAISPEDSLNLSKLIYSLPNGVMAMSHAIDGLVETSLNLGILEVKDGELQLVYALRSSVESAMDSLFDRIVCIADAFGATVSSHGRYQPMEYRADSVLRKVMMDIYQEMYGEEMVVDAIHAGVECGIFAGKIAGLDAVSIGPNLRDIHTPNETMEIESVVRTWKYVLSVLDFMGSHVI